MGFSAGGAVVATAGYILLRHLSYGPPAKNRCQTKHLTPREVSIIEKLFHDFFEPDITGFPVVIDKVIRRADEYIGLLPSRNKRMLKGGLLIIEHGTLFSRRIFSPYTRLSKEDRMQYLESWESSSSIIKRQIIAGIKMFIGLLVFSLEEPNEFLGVHKECGG